MEEAGAGTDERGLEIVEGKQYSNRSGSAGRSRVAETGGKK